MKRIMFLFFSILLQFQSFCQNNKFIKPYHYYSEIKPIITNDKSLYFYPYLEARYIENDTTLNQNEYYLLYYGYNIYFGSEVPYNSEYNNSLYLIYGKATKAIAKNGEKTVIIQKDKLSNQDYLEIIKYENLILRTHLFDFVNLEQLADAYHNIEDYKNEYLIRFKINMIIKTILNSGNGKLPGSAYFINSQSHDSYVIKYFGFEEKGRETYTYTNAERIDCISIMDNPQKIKRIYFDKSFIIQAK